MTIIPSCGRHCRASSPDQGDGECIPSAGKQMDYHWWLAQTQPPVSASAAYIQKIYTYMYYGIVPVMVCLNLYMYIVMNHGEHSAKKNC